MKKHTRYSLLTLSVITALAGSLSGVVYAENANGGVNKNGVPTMLMRPDGDDQFAPDPAKRLTVENFDKGMKKLHEYLVNAIKNGKEEDKKFLVKEKAEIEKQMSDVKKAHIELFDSIEKEYQRSLAINIFPKDLVKQMRKHFLETEAARVIGIMQQEQKKRENDRAFAAEVNYQKGIIAERDQINFKSAIRYYELAANGQPRNIDYLSALSRMYMVVEDHGSAVKRYNELLEMVKKQPNSEKKVKFIKKQLKKALKQIQLATES